MTIVNRSDRVLRRRLASPAATVLLLSDEDGDVAERIHDAATAVLRAGQFVFLLRDLDLLTGDERKLWFDAGGHYAVIGGPHRVVAVRGTLDEFLLSDGKPSAIELRYALARGDRL